MVHGHRVGIFTGGERSAAIDRNAMNVEAKAANHGQFGPPQIMRAALHPQKPAKEPLRKLKEG